ncbi:hypothetical protein [Candidatus Hodarchaeum mangrovi]
MFFVTPSFLKEFNRCPHAFYLRRIQHFELGFSKEVEMEIIAYRKIEEYTKAFFTILFNPPLSYSVITHREEISYLLKARLTYNYSLESLNELLVRKCFSFLGWLIQELWVMLPKNKRHQKYIHPNKIYELILSDRLKLKGCPSLVFLHPNNTYLLVIQSFNSNPISNRLIISQAAIYSQILWQNDKIKSNDFLYIDYQSNLIIYRKFVQKDYQILSDFLQEFHDTIEDELFDSPNTNNCKTCEFRLICELTGDKNLNNNRLNFRRFS